MSEPAAPAAPAAKPTASGSDSKGLPWGIPAFIILFCFALAIGVTQMYENKKSFEWLVEFVFRLLPPIILISILLQVIKALKK